MTVNTIAQNTSTQKIMNELNTKEYPSVQDMNDDQRIGIVKDIFASVTDKYDFLNRVLSCGRDVAWRNRTVSEMFFLA